MLQYLVNVTMIWLFSLLAFDLLLRRESYHSYNRLYLLFTFAMGMFLPLWQWDNNNGIYQAIGTTQTVSGIVATKQNIVAVATEAPQAYINWQLWVMIAYLAGVIFSIVLLIKDIIILVGYNRNGKKSKDGVWYIIETGKKHSPFSAFRYIYISSKEDYSTEELRMILTHEELHGHALHFIDTILLQAGKIIFWFHPFVYLYQDRLLMLHEYQADAAAGNEPAKYGRFLVQQALLHPAPTLSHSFNRSPIKKRILMLTRKSSFMAGFKRLAILPLGIICIFLFTENAISKEAKKDGGKLYYKGNVFELWSPHPEPDTVMVQNPVTGEMELRISRLDSFPVTMNGKEIFRVSELSRTETETYLKTTGAEIKNYYAEKMKPAISKLSNGTYSIVSYLILDEKGNIVYHDKVTISDRNWTPTTPDSEMAMRKKVAEELEKIIANTNKKFSPAKRSGIPVIMRQEELFSMTTFKVENHQVTMKENQ